MTLPALCLYLALSTTAPHDATIELVGVSYQIHAATYQEDVAKLCSAWNHQAYFDEMKWREALARE